MEQPILKNENTSYSSSILLSSISQFKSENQYPVTQLLTNFALQLLPMEDIPISFIQSHLNSYIEYLQTIHRKTKSFEKELNTNHGDWREASRHSLSLLESSLQNKWDQQCNTLLQQQISLQNKWMEDKTKSEQQLQSMIRTMDQENKEQHRSVDKEIKEMNRWFFNQQEQWSTGTQQIHQELRKVIQTLQVIPTNETKKILAENHVLKILEDSLSFLGYRIKHVGKDPHMMDIQIITPQGLTIGIDTKNYADTVDRSETQKTKTLLEKHSFIDVGIIISLRSNIEVYKDVHHLILNNNRLLWFFPQFSDRTLPCLIPLIMFLNTLTPYLKKNINVIEEEEEEQEHKQEKTEKTEKENHRIMMEKLIPIVSLVIQKIKNQDQTSDPLLTSLNSIQKSLNKALKSYQDQKIMMMGLLKDVEQMAVLLTFKTSGSEQSLQPPISQPTEPTKPTNPNSNKRKKVKSEPK
jgi:hypothetical protein